MLPLLHDGAAMNTNLQFEILAQPDDTTCGPTCLQALYNYYGDDISLYQVIQEVRQFNGGGTLAVLMGCHALQRGYRVKIYTFNLEVFDPTWFKLTPKEMQGRLRLQMRAKNNQRIRSASKAYLEIFQRMYRDIAPFDPDGTLKHEFLNSRGAIARFDRGTIEIRVLDIQECPIADLAAADLITAAIETLCGERWISLEKLKKVETQPLVDIFLAVIRDADDTVIQDRSFLEAVGMKMKKAAAIEIWQHLAEACSADRLIDPIHRSVLQTLFSKGCLARRIVNAVGTDLRKNRLKEVYGALCDCLARGEQFQ